MRNHAQLKARMTEIVTEADKLKAAYERGDIEQKRYDGRAKALYDEAKELESEFNALKQARRYAGAAEAANGGQLAGAWGEGVGFSPGAGMNTPSGSGGYVHLPTPMHATAKQWQQLTNAMTSGTAFRTQVTPRQAKGISGSIAMKAYTPALESGITGSPFGGTLPPIMSPYAVGLPVDPLDIASLLPAVAMTGPSATQIVHTANTNPAAIVPENAVKPDLGPQFQVIQIVPSLVACTVETSYQGLQDTSSYGDGSWAQFLPVEATLAYQDKVNDILINAVSGTAGATFNGLLNISGVLTQSAAAVTPLNALSLGFTAIRNGTAKADADLVLMSPNTLGALRRLTDGQGRYQLGLLSGPLELSAYGQPEARANEPDQYFREPFGTKPFNGSLWGAEIAVTTHIPDGTAAVLSIKGGALLLWIRAALELFYNPGYGDILFQQNLVAWRVESRLALNSPRPSAICLVTGLPTS